MTKHVVILGGGTGGTLGANRLRRELGDDVHLTVVDQDDSHVYQPGLLFVPFGLTHPEDIIRSRRRQLHTGIDYRQDTIDHVDIESQQVHLADGSSLHYDVLIVATGSVLTPEETEGLAGPGWMEKVFTFYTPDGAAASASPACRRTGAARGSARGASGGHPVPDPGAAGRGGALRGEELPDPRRRDHRAADAHRHRGP